MPELVDLPLDKPDSKEESKANDTVKQRKIDTALDMLSGSLCRKLNDYVAKRYEKETEWFAAEKQYNGKVDGISDKKLAALKEIRGGELPLVNITRPKTNIAIARLQDVQFPLGGDFNFCVEATPMPELEELQTNQAPMPLQGPPGMEGEEAAPAPTYSDAAKAAITQAKDKAKKMEMVIHDYFVETEWAKRSRRAMEQMGILGTAVLKAPVLQHKRRKGYKSLDDAGTMGLDIAHEIVPTVQWVDVRMWFPDPSARPGTSIDDSFELHLMTARELRNLAHNPAFMQNRIREALKEEPRPDYIAKSHLLNLIGSQSDNLDNRYSVMEYHGTMDKDVLFELDLIDEEMKDDPLVMLQGEVWFVNDRIIRVSVAPLEGEEQIPYFVCTWEDDQASVFGHGIPYLMRNAQKVANSSWMMLLDNAGLTAGPQIVLNKEMIQPANRAEGWEIKPMKVWFMTEYGTNVNEAMQFVNVPTQQDSITNIIELSMQFADVESSIPQILHGEVPQANNTSFGGMAMVMTNAHIIQQRISERWDDNITVPVVERFYHYEMQYGDDASVKGDFEVKAGGATERIDKQVKAQDLERIIGMAGSNEQFMEQIDLGEAFREWVATTRAGNILRPRAEIEAARQEAAANPAPDPALIEAQARQQQAEAAMAKIQLDREMKQMEFDLRAQIEEARVDKESREIMARERENQIKLQIAQLQREDLLIKLAAEQNKTQAEIAKDLDIAVMSETTKRLNKQADLDKFNTEIEIKRQTGEGI